MKIVPNASRHARTFFASKVSLGILALVILSPSHLTYSGRSGYWLGAKHDDGSVTILSTHPSTKLADARKLAEVQHGHKATYIAPEKTATVSKVKKQKGTKVAA
jgi:hypothetical protein